MTVLYTHHGAGAVPPLIPDLAALYATVYAEPPYLEGPEQVARFADGLPDDTRRPGFMMVTAHDAQWDGWAYRHARLVGFAYGWTMPAGTWWQRADQEPPAEVRDADKLAVMEWVVASDQRGAGIGAGLMRRLLEGRAERYATLASDPRSHARAVYARNGWRRVGKSVLPWGPPMDLLVLDLTSPTVQHG